MALPHVRFCLSPVGNFQRPPAYMAGSVCPCSVTRLSQTLTSNVFSEWWEQESMKV